MEKRRKQIYNNYLLFRKRYDLNKEIDFLNFYLGNTASRG